MTDLIGYALHHKPCWRCHEQFATNYYGHETLCDKCKRKEARKKFFKSPIKGILKMIIKWTEE